MKRYLFASLALATLHSMALAAEPPDSVDADGYTFVGKTRITGWKDEKGGSGSDARCESGRTLLLSNGQALKCQNSGSSSSRDAYIYRKGDYYKLRVGVDTFRLHN